MQRFAEAPLMTAINAGLWPLSSNGKETMAAMGESGNIVAGITL